VTKRKKQGSRHVFAPRLEAPVLDAGGSTGRGEAEQATDNIKRVSGTVRARGRLKHSQLQGGVRGLLHQLLPRDTS